MNNISSTKEKITNLVFYLSILLFFLGFNFTDNPPSGWYLQTLPNLNGRSISDVTFTDSLTGYATAYIGTDSNYVLKTTNGGDNWFFIYSDYALLRRIQFLNENTGYICGAYLQKTTNGGINWTSLNTSGIGVENMYVLNQDTIWITDSEPLTGGVFRTTNGGLNWTQQLSAGNQNPDKIYMYNARIGFICKSTSGYYVRKTTDGGNSWFTVIPNESFRDIYFIDSLTGWSAWAVDSIKKTTDGGITWYKQLLPPSQNLNGESGITKFSFLNKDTIWAVGAIKYNTPTPPQARGLIYISTNGGDNWGYQLPNPNLINIYRYYFINFTNKNNGWAYSVINGIHTVTGGDSTIIVNTRNISSEVPKDYLLYQNYPNPFNNSSNFKIKISKLTNVRIIVYDINGREVQTIVNKRLIPGVYEFEINGNHLSSGIYFYSLIVDGKVVDTKKAMLLK